MHSNDHFYYINSPVAVMRQAPNPLSEVVSQGIFSEQAYLLEQAGSWVKIETVVDRYQGWIKSEELYSRNNNFFEDSNYSFAHVTSNAAHLYHLQDTIYGPLLTLPFESRLKVIESYESNSRWLKVAFHDDRECYIQRGDVSLEAIKINTFSEICAFSQKFLGLPYTWGGRSSFGYDCSGFVQMLYRQMGIYLPRDSKEQCHCKEFIDVPIEQMQTGDLIFFGLNINQIRHVGMYIGNGSFINATVLENMPYIHVSQVEGREWMADGKGKYPFRAARRVASL